MSNETRRSARERAHADLVAWSLLGHEPCKVDYCRCYNLATWYMVTEDAATALRAELAAVTERAERLTQALSDAATSLETCANWKGGALNVTDAYYDLRGYANSRATVARAAALAGRLP